jgi:2-keto-3-deoxy-L-rhamnonate aldolase RhmA
LYVTEAKLKNAETRKKVVQFVRALNQTYELFRDSPNQVYATVAQTVGFDWLVLKNV